MSLSSSFSYVGKFINERRQRSEMINLGWDYRQFVKFEVSETRGTVAFLDARKESAKASNEEIEARRRKDFLVSAIG